MAAVRRFGSEIAQQSAAVPHRHGRLRHLLTETAAIIALLAVLVALWWTWVEVKDISPIVVPRPSAVLDDLVAAPGDYLSATVRTLWTAAIALTIGTVLGLAAALAAARYEFLAGMTVPLVIVLAATPLVALFPLFARVLGYNPTTVWALASVLVFYPIFVFTRSGLTAASKSALDIVDSLGGRERGEVPAGGAPGRRPAHDQRLPDRRRNGRDRSRRRREPDRPPRLGGGVRLRLPAARPSPHFGAAIVVIAVSVVVFSVVGRLERSVHTRWT